ncbi:MAG: DICT sensory domain-containing protein [Halodesulfurarchaeum sp.]
MSLQDFVRDLPPREPTLVVVNRTEPRPVQSLLEATFDAQTVAVVEESIPDAGEDIVLLVEDGTVTASSSLTSLEEHLLLVNTDLFATGSRSLETVELPDVLAALDDVPFRLRGYPESNREKLLLVLVSRFIERQALEGGAGTLRTGFQRLSRIEDERGTRFAYERLAESGVDVHVYGVPDWMPPPDLDVVAHGAHLDELRESWFVVFVPPAGRDSHYALVAVEQSPRTWAGFWTRDAEYVAEIHRYLEETL